MTGRRIATYFGLVPLRRFYLYKTSCNMQVRFCHSQLRKTANNLDIAHFVPDIIRNFCIIAHIDHGKSTLADRILEHVGAISKDEQNKQVLDKLQIERERGITVKAQTATIFYKHKGKEYMLNLIDTPGHVDFSYEVSKSLNACEGVILLVDASQGIQAQTVAHFYQAFFKDLVIIPVLNKIDMKNAAPEVVTKQLFTTFDIDPNDVLKVSAKLGTGIDELLANVVEKIPPPAVPKESNELRALLLDSWYESKRHVVCLAQVKEGKLEKGKKVKTHYTNKNFEIKNVGILTPHEVPVAALNAGQVGIFTAGIVKTSDTQLGDTISKLNSKVEPLPGFEASKPMVFAGIFPMEIRDYEEVRAAVNKLTLNDSSVSMTPDSSLALGFGWRMGFLGVLHMEVFITRLEQEFNASVISTIPSVPYKVHMKSKKSIKEGEEMVIIDNPRDWPAHGSYDETFEPMIKATIIAPQNCLKSITQLCEERRGTSIDSYSIDTDRLLISYELPLSEVIVDFYSNLKNITSGYATFDYEDMGYRSVDVIKLDIKLNGKVFPEFSIIVPTSESRSRGKRMCLKLLDHIRRHQFQIVIQACHNSVVLGRQDINQLRKNVTAKCYGGDITRKMKLLSRQAEGKKKMKMFGNIEIDRDTFLEILKK